MKWEKVKETGDWQAVGENGDFLIWRHGKVWKARWRSTDKTVTKHFPIAYLIKTAKVRCERSDYWEE